MGVVDGLVCRRCGACCWLVSDGVQKKCPHLVYLGSGRALCRIYGKRDRVGSRIGVIGDQVFVCSMREDMHINFPDCPYNREGWG